jgi:hypothetical protein
MTAFAEHIGGLFGTWLVVISSFLSPATPPQETPVTTNVVTVPEEEQEKQIVPRSPPEPPIEEREFDLATNTMVVNPETDIETKTDAALIPYLDSQKAHGDLKKALVNIHCTLKSQGPNKPLTASGVVIDPKGIVLTNAHVAQYILLRDFVQEGSINCSIRKGSPAKESHAAEVLYISPEWIEKQKANIFSNNPTGTGKNDYAFLLLKPISEDGGPEEQFDFIAPEINDIDIDQGDDILIGAYPAGILDSLSINRVLFGITLKTKIKQLLTFGDEQIDILSTGGSYLAQKGSSGGAVMNEEGEIIGLFVTSTQESNFKERDLRAITMAHIERSLEEFGDISLDSLLDGNPEEISEAFNGTVSPLLAKILLEEIQSR